MPETPSQTTFATTTDLDMGAVLYWRARAGDGGTAVPGDWSAPIRFRVGLADGKYRYWLSLSAPPPCDQVGFPKLVPSSLTTR